MINNNCHKTNVIGSNFILKSFFFFPQDLDEITVNKRALIFRIDIMMPIIRVYLFIGQWALHEWLGAWSNSKLLWYVRVKEWRPCWSLSNNHEFDVRAFRVGSWEHFPWQTVAHVNLYNGLALNALDCPCWSLFIA